MKYIVAIVATQEKGQGYIEKWEVFDDYHEAWDELIYEVNALHKDLGGPTVLPEDFEFGQSIHYTFTDTDGLKICAQIV